MFPPYHVLELKEKIYARPLDQSEWELFRDIRLEALTVDADKFGASREVESQYNEHVWKNWIESEGKRVFGLFLRQEVIGITSVITWNRSHVEIRNAAQWADPEKTAFCVASYIKSAYRGRGFYRLLNQSSLDWAFQQPRFKRAVTAHRLSNVIAAKTHLEIGFKPLEKTPYKWSDGSLEDVVICIVDFEHWRARARVF